MSVPPVADIMVGDVRTRLAELPVAHFHSVVTSPPYWGLRDYGVADQIGLEESPQAFVDSLVAVFREVRRVLRDDGTLWMNLGDSYSGARSGMQGATGQRRGRRQPVPPLRIHYAAGRPKELLGIPWRVALALQADGWYLRQDVIWHKPSPMPESVQDRCTKAHEYIFLLTKSPTYFFDAQAIAEPCVSTGVPHASDIPRGDNQDPELRKLGVRRGSPRCIPDSGLRNARSVWTIASQPYSGAHFATFPEALPERCILAGTSARGCCAACGAPWERVTERQQLRRERPNELTKRNGTAGTGNHCANTVAGVAVLTRGWRQTCGCEADTVPCRVLDPFMGSGTTLAVALRLGRAGVGVELNPEYARQARARIDAVRATAPLFLGECGPNLATTTTGAY